MILPHAQSLKPSVTYILYLGISINPRVYPISQCTFYKFWRKIQNKDDEFNYFGSTWWMLEKHLWSPNSRAVVYEPLLYGINQARFKPKQNFDVLIDRSILSTKKFSEFWNFPQIFKLCSYQNVPRKNFQKFAQPATPKYFVWKFLRFSAKIGGFKILRFLSKNFSELWFLLIGLRWFEEKVIRII